MIQQSHFGVYILKIKIRISKRHLHSHVHCGIIHNAQDMGTTEMSIEGWVGKENVVHYSALEKELLPYATTWMNLEDLGLSEVSQSQKNKYFMIQPIWSI